MVRSPKLKTWIPAVHELNLMKNLTDLENFHFGGQEVVSKLESPFFLCNLNGQPFLGGPDFESTPRAQKMFFQIDQKFHKVPSMNCRNPDF